MAYISLSSLNLLFKTLGLNKYDESLILKYPYDNNGNGSIKRAMSNTITLKKLV